MAWTAPTKDGTRHHTLSAFVSKVMKHVLEQSEFGHKLFKTFMKDQIQPEKIQSLVTDGEKAPVMENHEEEDQGFKCQPNSGVNYKKTETCLSAWWWHAKADLRSTSKKLLEHNWNLYSGLRSMFATDAEMLHCSAKSTSMSILEKQSANTDKCWTAGQDAASQVERTRVCHRSNAIPRQAWVHRKPLTPRRSLYISHLMETVMWSASPLIDMISRHPWGRLQERTVGKWNWSCERFWCSSFYCACLSSKWKQKPPRTEGNRERLTFSTGCGLRLHEGLTQL